MPTSEAISNVHGGLKEIRLALHIKIINRKKVKLKYWLFLLFILSSACYYFWGNHLYSDYMQRMRHHSFITTAEALNSSLNAKSSNLKVRYVYEINGTEFNKNSTLSYPFSYENAKKCIGKNFPVIVDSTNYSDSYLLISESDFKKFGMNWPDTISSLFK